MYANFYQCTVSRIIVVPRARKCLLVLIARKFLLNLAGNFMSKL